MVGRHGPERPARRGHVAHHARVLALLAPRAQRGHPPLVLGPRLRVHAVGFGLAPRPREPRAEHGVADRVDAGAALGRGEVLHVTPLGGRASSASSSLSAEGEVGEVGVVGVVEAGEAEARTRRGSASPLGPQKERGAGRGHRLLEVHKRELCGLARTPRPSRPPSAERRAPSLLAVERLGSGAAGLGLGARCKGGRGGKLRRLPPQARRATPERRSPHPRPRGGEPGSAAGGRGRHSGAAGPLAALSLAQPHPRASRRVPRLPTPAWKLDALDSDEGSLYDARELAELLRQFDAGEAGNGPASVTRSEPALPEAGIEAGIEAEAGAALPDSDGEFSLFGGEDGARQEEEEPSPASSGEEKGEDHPRGSAAIPAPAPASAPTGEDPMLPAQPLARRISSPRRGPSAASRLSPATSSANAKRPPAPPPAAQDHRIPAGTTAPHAAAGDSPAAAIHVRSGPNYKKNGLKAPSGEALYEFRAVDVVAFSKARLGNVAKTVLRVTGAPGEEARRAASAATGLPLYFVVNVQLPTKAPGMFGSNSDDFGVSVVFSFVLRELARLPPADEASVRLALAFFSGEVQGRFKVIGYLDNLAEMGVPALLARTVEGFNGKPVIVFKTGAFSFDPAESVYECGVAVHEFPFMVKSSLAVLRSKVKLASLRAAFVVQGESDDELPERLLGCAAVRGLDLERAVLV